MDLRYFNFETLEEMKEFQKLLDKCVDFHTACEAKKTLRNQQIKQDEEATIAECMKEGKNAKLGARIQMFLVWLKWVKDNIQEDQEVNIERVIHDYQELFEDILTFESTP